MRRLRILKTTPAIMTEGHIINNKEMIDHFKSPLTEVVYRGLPNCGVRVVNDERSREIVAPLHVKMVLDAEKEGFDAIAMGCLLEPGVKEAKEKCKIPIIGALEASLHFASMLGSRFSFVVGGSDKVVKEEIPRGGRSNILVDLIRSYGLVSRLASIRGIGLETLDFFPEYKNLDKLKELMLRESRKAIEEDEANVIVMYGGITVLGYLQKNLPVPIINQKQAQIMMAEALANSQFAKYDKS
jgi:allantoin racemase